MNPRDLILAGMGVMILGIAVSVTLDRSEALELPKDEDVQALGYTFRYVGSRPVEAGSRDAYDVVVSSGSARGVLSPTMDYSEPMIGTKPSSASHSFFTRNVCVAPVKATGESVASRLNPRLVLRENETAEALGLTVTFLGFTTRTETEDSGDSEVTARVRVTRGDTETELALTALTRPGGIEPGPGVPVPGTDWTLVLDGVDATNRRVRLDIHTGPVDLAPPTVETLWVEASVKPLAGLIRPGAVAAILGIIWAVLRRVRRKRIVSDHS